MAASSIKVQSDTFSAEKKATAQAQQRQTVTSSGIFNQEKHIASSTQSNFSYTQKGICSTGSNMISSSQMKSMNGIVDDEILPNFEDLERLCSNSSPIDIDRAITKYSHCLDSYVKTLQRSDQLKKAPNVLDTINEIVRRAWAVPTFGHELSFI